MEKYFEYGEEEINHLKSVDEKMSKLIEKSGHIYRTVKPDLYDALVDSIIGQQISTAAHVTIRRRTLEKFGRLTPEKVNCLTDEELQSIGISFRKVSYIKDFTRKVISGDFDINALQNMSDEDVIKVLVELKGVGKWTAEMMLTFSMCRPDVISYGDLAIRRGVMKLYGLEELPEKEFKKLTDKFSPYRSTRAMYIWHYAAPDCDFTVE